MAYARFRSLQIKNVIQQIHLNAAEDRITSLYLLRNIQVGEGLAKLQQSSSLLLEISTALHIVVLLSSMHITYIILFFLGKLYSFMDDY